MTKRVRTVNVIILLFSQKSETKKIFIFRINDKVRNV